MTTVSPFTIGWITSKQRIRSFETRDSSTCSLQQLALSIEKWSPIVSQTTNLPSGTWLYCLPQTLPWLSLSFLFFTQPPALICWNDSPHIRGTNRMPSAFLSLSSLYTCPNPPPLPPPASPHTPGPERGCKCSLRSGLSVCRMNKWHHCSQKSAAHVLEHIACVSKWFSVSLQQVAMWSLTSCALVWKYLSGDFDIYNFQKTILMHNNIYIIICINAEKMSPCRTNRITSIE